MGIVNMIRNMKEIHKEDILLVKVGTFYYTYSILMAMRTITIMACAP